MKSKLLAIAIASVGAFVAALSTSLVIASAPRIATEFAALPADASWIVFAYLLSVGAFLALSNKAASLFGTKRVYLTGFVFLFAGSMMCLKAPMFYTVIGARVMQGAGAATLITLGPRIVERSRSAHSVGIQLAATFLGLVLGAKIGGPLAASHVGWHSVFAVIAGASALGGALAILALEPDDASAERPSIKSLDLAGAVLLGSGLTSLIVAIHRAQSEKSESDPASLFILVFAILSFAMFVRQESIHEKPLFPLGLLRTRSFLAGIFAATLLCVGTFIVAATHFDAAQAMNKNALFVAAALGGVGSMLGFARTRPVLASSKQRSRPHAAND